jgi:hypothetical protein
MNQYKAGLTELDAKQKDATKSAEDYAGALKAVAVAAEGGGGGGGGGAGKKGGGGGGAAKGIKAAGDAAKKAGEQMKEAEKQAQEFAQGLQQIAQSAATGLVDALFSIADGSKSAKEAFTDLAKSMLKQIANLIVQLLILKPLMGMFGGGFGGVGLMGGGLMSMGPSLRSIPRSSIGSYSGFNAPSTIQAFRTSSVSSGSSAQHTPPAQITVNNNSDAAVRFRQEQSRMIIDITLDEVAGQISRGGNKIDLAMQRAFGARRVGY